MEIEYLFANTYPPIDNCGMAIVLFLWYSPSCSRKQAIGRSDPQWCKPHIYEKQSMISNEIIDKMMADGASMMVAIACDG